MRVLSFAHMPVWLKELTLAVAAVCIPALLLAAVYAARASAEPDYAVYTNDSWHYSLAVPANMTAAEYDAEGGGQRVQFTDATGDKLFTVAAWPYTQYDLTLGREGTPSTIADQPDHLEIVNVVRNDVFTVLFEKNGVHYVVVTMPENEQWLIDILTTWRFTD